MTRAAIYRRISTSGQEDNTSLDVQREKCIEYATAKGYGLAGEYSDVHTGSDLWSRPDVNRLLADAEDGRFDVLVVYHTDRISREPDHLAYIRTVLKRSGVRVESVTNPRTESFEDQLMASFEALFSKHERTRIQERMRTGRRARAEKEGKLLPGGMPLYGYQWDDPAKSAKTRYVEDPSTSWVVRRVFEEAALGVPLRRIAVRLHEDGIRTMMGKQWQARQVSRLIQNPTYKGELYVNRYRSEKDPNTNERHDTVRPEEEWIRIPDGAPALVDPETWQRANDRLARNRVEKSRPYDKGEDGLLRAGFVYCAYCGNRMHRERRSGTTYYKCNTYYRRDDVKCRAWSVKAEPIDRYVWGRVQGWLGDPGVLFHEAERSRALVAETLVDDLETLDQGLAKLDAEQANLVQALSRLSGSAADPVVRKLNELGEKRDALLKRRDEAALRAEVSAKAETMMTAFWDSVQAYAGEVGTWGYAEKREMLHRLGVRVTVEKQGRAQGLFIVEATPPWPEGTEWWHQLFQDSYSIEAEIGWEEKIGEDGDGGEGGGGGVTVLPNSDQASGKRRSMANRTSSATVRIATGTNLPSSRRVSRRSSIETMWRMTLLYRGSMWCPWATQSLERVWISISPVRRPPAAKWSDASAKSGPKPLLQTPWKTTSTCSPVVVVNDVARRPFQAALIASSRGRAVDEPGDVGEGPTGWCTDTSFMGQLRDGREKQGLVRSKVKVSDIVHCIPRELCCGAFGCTVEHLGSLC